MLTNIDMDEAVVAEAMRLTGARSKRELVDRALRELLARANRPSVRDLFGIGGVDPDYDPKAVGASADQIGQFRVEQPRATYAVAEQVRPRAKNSPPGARRRESAPVTAKRKRPCA
ncbi:MAG: type II toxin-antitoxin system VapB family antitoxin [Burkholderiaceae bacterium]